MKLQPGAGRQTAEEGAVNPLTQQALLGLLRLQGILALLLFLPAGSLRFWEAWIYWTLFFGSALVITLYFLKHDPALIARRLEAGPSAEQEQSQKIIVASASVLAGVMLVGAGLDHRYQWSSVPAPVVLLAAALVLLGMFLVFRAFQANSYAAGTVRVEATQRVIATGPYRCVRHPMYTGAVLLFVATPLALGSWWTLPAAIALMGMIIVRLSEEEKYLAKNLPGYNLYRQQVRYRLIPYVW
jgi:protein-S-isoprenylcysteine O-methyltransferase Ste14